MEIRRYVSIARRWSLLIIAIIAAAVGAGFLITPRQHTYTSTSTLYVGSRSIDVNPAAGQLSADRVVGLDRLITTFTALVPTRPVAEAALARTGVKRTVAQVMAGSSAKQVANTELVLVSFTDRDPAVSTALANGIATALVDQIRSYEVPTAPGEQVISVYDTARGLGTPKSSGLGRNVALAGVFGLIVAGCVVALLEALDITIRTPDDAERLLALPVLAVVPASGDDLPINAAVSIREAPFLVPPPPTGGAEVG